MKLREIRLGGYRNLADGPIPFRDFTVIVGPNNSGKSNLLDIFHILHGLCFGPSESRRAFINGYSFTDGEGRECNMLRKDSENPPLILAIGVTLEVKVGEEPWIVDYDLGVRRGVAYAEPNDDSLGFQEERLRAKQPSKTGPAKKYFDRDTKCVTVDGKTHPMPIDASVLTVLPLLYPDFVGLPGELKAFFDNLLLLSKTGVNAFSPDAIRENIDGDAAPAVYRMASVPLHAAIDKIWSDRDKQIEFKDTVTDILELSDIQFHVQQPALAGKDQKEVSPQRFLMCLLENRHGELATIDEYSDGSLIVLALVAAVLLHDDMAGPICIEELENCLHPRAQEKLMRFLKTNAPSRQTIITTHSPYLVNGLDPDDILVGVVDEKGASHFQPTNRKAVNDLLKSGYMSFGDLMANNFKDVLKE